VYVIEIHRDRGRRGEGEEERRERRRKRRGYLCRETGESERALSTVRVVSKLENEGE
jgi:hypothetical protein